MFLHYCIRICKYYINLHSYLYQFHHNTVNNVQILLYLLLFVVYFQISDLRENKIPRVPLLAAAWFHSENISLSSFSLTSSRSTFLMIGLLLEEEEIHGLDSIVSQLSPYLDISDRRSSVLPACFSFWADSPEALWILYPGSCTPKRYSLDSQTTSFRYFWLDSRVESPVALKFVRRDGMLKWFMSTFDRIALWFAWVDICDLLYGFINFTSFFLKNVCEFSAWFSLSNLDFWVVSLSLVIFWFGLFFFKLFLNYF